MDKKDDKIEIYVTCPHCEQEILIMSNEVNCAIFRHGAYKKTGKQIKPHETKEVCEKLVEDNLIYGCGKPFKIFKKDSKYEAEICGYI
jgi:hypothetical protein